MVSMWFYTGVGLQCRSPEESLIGFSATTQVRSSSELTCRAERAAQNALLLVISA